MIWIKHLCVHICFSDQSALVHVPIVGGITPTAMEEWMSLSSGHNHIKAAKEEFVSNLDGASPWELLLIASTVPLGLYVFLSLSTWNRRSIQRPNGSDAAPRRGFWIIHIEFLSFWFPAILCQTVWSFPWAIVYFTALLILSSAYHHHAAAKNILGGVSEKQEDEVVNGKRKKNNTSEVEDNRAAVAAAFGVTIYRAALLCLTCVAILAVDFPIFPRRLAKTEVYGYGWMDLGAASFSLPPVLFLRPPNGGGFPPAVYHEEGKKLYYLSNAYCPCYSWGFCD
jgi:hypothetical protein